MLHKKARPKRKEKSLTKSCKGVGDLYRIYHDIVCSRLSNFGRVLGKTIPVLSIFAFLGMISYAVAIISFGDTFVPTEEAYAAVNPLSSLIIDNGKFTDNTTTDGSIFYSSHTIQVKASDIDGYSLTITEPTNIVNGDTTIGSAGNNVTGSNIPNNKWGYAWGNEETANGNMLYKGFTGNAQTLDDNTTTTISKDAVDFTKKLVFAVKFADNADTGHYKANVTLNLTLTPKATAKWSTGVDSGIASMQEMTGSVCRQVTTPAAGTSAPTLTLKDDRDEKNYTIARLTDGNCWMTQNMKLDLSTTSLSAGDSDVSADFAAKTEYKADSTWTDTNTQVQFTTNGKGSGSYNNAYGYYYNWCAATAGTCSSATGNHSEAPSSICPKGWQLPKGDRAEISKNDFAKLMNLEGANLADPMTSNVYVSWSSKLVAGPPAAFTLGGAEWVRAGSVVSGGLSSPGSYAYYWSRTTYSSTNAYYLSLASSGNLYPATSINRYFGNSVRCVAYKDTTYTIKYQYGNGMTGPGFSSVNGLPSDESYVGEENTHEFTISSSTIPGIISNGVTSCVYLTKWMGSDGKIYTPGAKVTLTEKDPTLILTTYEVGTIDHTICEDI